MDIKEYQHAPELVEAVEVVGGQIEEVVGWINKYST
jgi:hypothetical protein